MEPGVVVVGDGPAGSALAAACAVVGLDVTLVAPEPGRPWPATYGAWVDELTGVEGLDGSPATGRGDEGGVWRHVYADPVVAFDGVAPFGLGRPYGLLDNPAVQAVLLEQLTGAGGAVRAARVRGAVHTDAGSALTLDDGSVLHARLVIDATGHRPALLAPDTTTTPAWQVAHGIVARVADAPVSAGGMAFMDWRTPAGLGADPPTFLYAMDLGDGRVFLEETSLAARPALAVSLLEERLHARLAGVGAVVGEIEATEVVAFPMGVGVPSRPQRVVGYGAAAGLIHPATGYQVAAALRRAPPISRRIADALAGGPHPDAAAAAAWEAVWPDDLLRQRALQAYGLKALLGFDSRATQRFFQAFFSLPAADWHAYLSGATSSRDLARIMLAVARRLPPSLTWKVTSGALGREGVALARAAFAGRAR